MRILRTIFGHGSGRIGGIIVGIYLLISMMWDLKPILREIEDRLWK